MNPYHMLANGNSLSDVSRAITRQDIKRVTLPCPPPDMDDEPTLVMPAKDGGK